MTADVCWLAHPVLGPNGERLSPGWVSRSAFPWIPEDAIDPTKKYEPSR